MEKNSPSNRANQNAFAGDTLKFDLVNLISFTR